VRWIIVKRDDDLGYEIEGLVKSGGSEKEMVDGRGGIKKYE
jgi:hypothetical protein